MSKLLKYIDGKNYINGEYVNYSKNFLDVINPTSLEVIGNIPMHYKDSILKAIDAATIAFKPWSKTSAKKRREILINWQKLILENLNELAEILTLEQGKPLDDAKKEIIYGANFIGWFASECNSVGGHIFEGIKKIRKSLLNMNQ